MSLILCVVFEQRHNVIFEKSGKIMQKAAKTYQIWINVEKNTNFEGCRRGCGMVK